MCFLLSFSKILLPSGAPLEKTPMSHQEDKCHTKEDLPWIKVHTMRLHGATSFWAPDFLLLLVFVVALPALAALWKWTSKPRGRRASFWNMLRLLLTFWMMMRLMMLMLVFKRRLSQRESQPQSWSFVAAGVLSAQRPSSHTSGEWALNFSKRSEKNWSPVWSAPWVVLLVAARQALAKASFSSLVHLEPRPVVKV